MSSKFTQVHVYIIGGVLMLLLGVGLFFALIKPLNEQNASIAAEIQTKEGTQVSVDNQNFTIVPSWETNRQAAQEKLKEAEARQKNKAARLVALENKRQLPPRNRIDIGNGSQAHLINVTMPRWLVLPRYVVQMMNSYARRKAADRGVRVTTAFKAPAPTTKPDLIPRQIIAWNLGTVEVTGDFRKVMQWAEDWNDAPLLVALDGLKCSVEGRDGEVKATGSITVYVFPTGEAVTNAPASQGSVPGMVPGGVPGGVPGNVPGGAPANGPVGGPGVANGGA